MINFLHSIIHSFRRHNRGWIVMVFTLGLWACFLNPANAIVDTGNQRGEFSGQWLVDSNLSKGGEWWYDHVVIQSGCTVSIPPYNGGADTGFLILHANRISIAGTIDARGCGYSGHGGAGGQSGGSRGGGGSWNSSGGSAANGAPAVGGASENGKGSGPYGGGDGFGFCGGNGGGGQSGSGGGGGSGGTGGGGGAPGWHAADGGYAVPAGNGDDSTGEEIYMGSAAGSGGGGASGGGGGGGAGCGLVGCTAYGGDGGNGGAGGTGGTGGNGGGYIKLYANDRLDFFGSIDTRGTPGSQGGSGSGGSGGGHPNHGHPFGYNCGYGGDGGAGGFGSNGGNGAGGGVLFFCSRPEGFDLQGVVDTRGGELSAGNTGTLKFFTPGAVNLNALTAYTQRLYTASTLTVPATPQLQTPLDGTALLPRSTTFTAFYSGESGPGVVHFKISRTPDFAADVFYQIIGDGSSNSFVANCIPDLYSMSTFGYGHYYWMTVNSDITQHASAPSVIRQFDIVYNYPPLLQLPNDHFLTSDHAITLSARYYPNAMTPNEPGMIHFQVATDPAFTHLIFDETTVNMVSPETIVTTSLNQLPSATYYWRAQNVDDMGICSVYSEPRSWIILPENTPTPTPTPTVAPSMTPTPMAVGQYLYVINALHRLEVYSQSSPRQLLLILPEKYKTWGIYIKAGYAYLVDGKGTLEVKDIHDLQTPMDLSQCRTGGEALGIAGYKNLLLIADGEQGVLLYDMIMPNDLRVIRRVGGIGNARGISVVEAKHQAHVVMPDGLIVVMDLPELGADPSFPDGGYATPNPFLPLLGQKTFFNFRMEDITVGFTIHVFNIRGQLQRTLTNTREWDGRREDGGWCSGGIYIYQIAAGNKRLSGKVVLIK